MKGDAEMGYNLRKIRESKGMTQGELAEKSGISRITICRIENETQKDLLVGNLNKLAAALDCEVSDLICEKNLDQKYSRL